MLDTYRSFYLDLACTPPRRGRKDGHRTCAELAASSNTTPQGVPQEVVHRMNETIVHRGPDDEGIYCGEGIGFGFRRLSIIDLSGGHQPISNEDGRLWVMLNGEIYNYPELRHELESRGHRFATHSDTETIVHLYEEYGEDCFRRLRGMFAIALWDSQERKLLLARDRVGKNRYSMRPIPSASSSVPN